MIIIKRYANRKFYNATAQKYVSLKELTQLVLEGERLCIIEHPSGKDITAAILAQILHRQEKQRPTNVPSPILSQLIRINEASLSAIINFADAVYPILRATERELHLKVGLFLPMGGISKRRENEALSSHLLDVNEELMQKGEEEAFQETLSEYPTQLLPATRNDLRLLQQEIEHLSAKIDALLEKMS